MQIKGPECISWKPDNLVLKPIRQCESHLGHYLFKKIKKQHKMAAN